MTDASPWAASFGRRAIQFTAQVEDGSLPDWIDTVTATLPNGTQIRPAVAGDTLTFDRDLPEGTRISASVGPLHEVPHAWWKQAVFYQIYPRSFADSNGDGIGDLAGIIGKLDYLSWLGVDAIWLSPHYPSPQADVGYDVADYTDVNPEYGDLHTFRRLLDEAHRRNIKVIVDLVMNHTSNEHQWFLESRSSKDHPRRDWYVWHPGSSDDSGTPRPPNNWLSVFGGPAWTYDETTGEWYYHFFLTEQPDLNWHNPAVAEAMWQAVRFWLDLGVDGFRLDAIGTLFEDPTLADHDADFPLVELIDRRFRPHDPGEDVEWRPKGWAKLFGRQHDLPEVHDVMRSLRLLIDRYPDKVLVGETSDLAYHGTGDDELQLVFNFPLMDVHRLTPAHVRTNQRARLAGLPVGAWPCNTFGNHDADRVRSRFADGEHDLDWARVAAALVLLLPGTPSLYQGEEIGMENLILPVDRLIDPIGPWYHREAIHTLGLEPGVAAERAARFSRDRCRTPMQWEANPGAGFSPPGVAPWLPIHPNHAQGVDVATQAGDPDSLLSWYRSLIALRRRIPALRVGGYEELLHEHRTVLGFMRFHHAERVAVFVNMSPQRHTVPSRVEPGEILFGSPVVHADSLDLPPFGVAVIGAS